MDWKSICLDALLAREEAIREELKPYISGRGRVSPLKSGLVSELRAIAQIRNAINAT